MEQAWASEQRQAAALDYWQAQILRHEQPTVAAAWAREVAGRPGVEAELRAFVEAVGKRLGEDGARALVQGARGGADRPWQRESLAEIGRALAVVGEGQLAHAAAQERARKVEQERLGLRPRRGPRLGM